MSMYARFSVIKGNAVNMDEPTRFFYYHRQAFGEDNVQIAKHFGNLGRLYQSMKRYGVRIDCV
jgi:hypothetical protein